MDRQTATDAPFLPPLKVLLTFTRDGGVVETRRLYNPESPFGPLVFTDFFQAAPNNAAADGTVLGEEEVRYRITLDPSGENLDGQLVGEIKDSEGNLVFTFSANVRATRIH